MDEGERTLVIQSVLNRQRTSHFAVLEYSFNGDTAGRLGASRVIPPGRPQIPVTGALVTLSHDGPGPCAGRVDTLREASNPNGTYSINPGCTLTPDARVRLRVVTLNGEVATSETRVPGFTGRSVVSGGRSAQFALDTLPIYRERDTLRIRMSAGTGPGLQIEVRRAEVHSDLSMYVFTDSLGLAMPGTLVNPFKNDGIPAFGPGRYYLLTIALADTNYFDFIRSLSDPVTGRGFLNHISGGIGVFGSVDLDQYLLRVVGDQHDPREGTYRITGRAGTANLDFTLDVYLTDPPQLDHEKFSALVAGGVQDGPVAVSGDGAFGLIPGTSTFSPDAIAFSFPAIRQTPPRFRLYSLRGLRSSNGSPFSMELAISNQNGTTLARTTVTAVQTKGPSNGITTP